MKIKILIPALLVLCLLSSMGFAAQKLADGHANICQENYTQCMQGCDGMESCSNQCQANYDGCMGQGG